MVSTLRQEDALPDPRDEKIRDLCSFRSALYEVSDSQTIDEQWYQDKDTWVIVEMAMVTSLCGAGVCLLTLGTRGESVVRSALTGTVTSMPLASSSLVMCSDSERLSYLNAGESGLERAVVKESRAHWIV